MKETIAQKADRLAGKVAGQPFDVVKFLWAIVNGEWTMEDAREFDEVRKAQKWPEQ